MTTISTSTNLSQTDVANGPFSIVGSGSSSTPVVITLTSDLTLTSANTLFTDASGSWVLNGNGHKISVDGVSGFYGLFSNINSGGTVENLSVVGINGATMGSSSGAIAEQSSGIISHVSSNLATGNNGGGLVCHMAGGSIDSSFSTGAISGDNSAGIVENVSGNVSLTNVYTTGDISGGNSGGIVEVVGAHLLAIDTTLTITNAYTTGNVSNFNTAGMVLGFVTILPGHTNTVNISNVYSTGAVTGLNGSGITDGDPHGSVTIAHAYHAGSVSSGGNQNAISAGPYSIVSNSGGTSSWSDASANSYLTGVGSVWIDPAGTTTPYTLASIPGAYTGSGSINGNNPWAGNTLQIYITDSTLNSSAGFYADQAALYGFGGAYGSPSQNLFHATYQWYADGVAISGANSSTFTITGAQIGKAITALVNYTNGNGVSSSIIQSPVATVNGVFDTAAHITSYLDTIESNHAAISAALGTSGSFQILDGANTATQFTAAQLANDTNAFALITGSHYLASVADTGAHLQSNLSSLTSNAGNLTSITLTDNGSVMLYGSNAVSLVPSFNNGNDFHTHAVADMLYNVATDGTLYIKTSGGTLATIVAGSTVLFADEIASTGSLANGSTTTFFHSSGGINGLTLPDLFTGPSSLGLTYQLIDSTQNAVVTGASSNDFIKVSDVNSVGKAVNGGGGNDVIDGGVGSTFVTGGDNHNDTFFLDGRAPGTSWSTITDFKAGTDKATIWGFVKGVSSIDASFTNYDHEGAAGYQGLTLHFKNLLPDGQTTGSNTNLNSITFTGHSLAEVGASSLADLNNQINNGTNAHILVGSTQDSLGTHSYLYFH